MTMVAAHHAFRMTLGLAALLTTRSVAAQVSNQSFEVTPQVAHATVGDSVSLRFRVRLDERDLLFDTVPQPLSTPPPGVRLLSVEKLRRTPDRIFHGSARVAFYRPGRQPVPVFGLPFMRAVKGVQRATLPSDSAFVEIVPLLPAGNPPLKDIRELEQSARPGFLPLAAVAALAFGLLVGYFRRHRARTPLPVFAKMAPIDVPPPPSPYTIALEALVRIEQERWPAHGLVTRHYESIVDTMRDYLEAAEDVPARERTTEEIVWSLPPRLSEAGLRDHFRNLLDEADLVKFARLRPEAAAAQLFLQRCRALLEKWHHTRARNELADALR